MIVRLTADSDDLKLISINNIKRLKKLKSLKWV